MKKKRDTFGLIGGHEGGGEDIKKGRGTELREEVYGFFRRPSLAGVFVSEWGGERIKAKEAKLDKKRGGTKS